MQQFRRDFSKIFFFFELLVILSLVNLKSVHAQAQKIVNDSESESNKSMLRSSFDPYNLTDVNELELITKPSERRGLSDTLRAGECKGCDSFNKVKFYRCHKIKIKACKRIKNVVVQYSDCSTKMFSDLNRKHFKLDIGIWPGISKVWVKAGCNESGDGPGYGRLFVNPYDCGARNCDVPTTAPTYTPVNCDEQKPGKEDPCDDYGLSLDGCKKRNAELKDEVCVFFNEPRYWLNGYPEWNALAGPDVNMRKACPSKAVNGAFLSEISTKHANGKFGPYKSQKIGCQAQWDSKNIISKQRCEESAQWNTWIIGNGKLGECGVSNADNEKCYAAVRYDFCGLLSHDTCLAAIHCSWEGNSCTERSDLDSKLSLATGVARKKGLYFQDSKSLTGPAIGNDKFILELPEVGSYNQGFIRLFGFKGCNKEFSLGSAHGATTVQVSCNGANGFKSIGQISTHDMDQSELHEYIFPIPNGDDCKTRMIYVGEGEVFWPSVRLGGFSLKA